MKKYLIILATILTGCGGLRGSNTGPARSTGESNKIVKISQDHSGYRSLRELSNDTLNYVRTSILARKDQYIGKELNVLLGDLEMSVKGYTIGTSNLIGISPSLSLQFFSRSQVEIKKQNRIDPVILTIRWETPLPMDSVEILNRKNKGVWTEDERRYFGRQKVKDIGIVRYNFE